MNRYLGQYHNGSWITFGIQADSIEEALRWTRENIQERGIVMAQIIPPYMEKDDCWMRQGASWSDVPTRLPH